MDPLEPLYERDALPAYDMPDGLAHTYGGAIGFPPRRLVANFVASIDGVVAIGAVKNAPSFISGKSEHDRFVMALLRASAGAVLIGAGTLRAEPEHRWTPEHVFPEGAEEFAALRRRLGLAEAPELAVVTSSGELDPGIPALEGAVIITGSAGAREVARRGVPAVDIIEAGEDGSVEPAAAVEALWRRGHALVLSEAGPRFTSQLLGDGLLDELFVTVSPVVLGRGHEDERAALADGEDLIASGPPGAELLSVRRAGSHLFLRYGFGTPRPGVGSVRTVTAPPS